MGILDDAIRDHIDLKRKHGARDTEVKGMEDDALGSGDRPDPFAPGDLFGGASAPAEGGPELGSQEAVAGPETPPPPSPEGAGPGEDPTMFVEPEARVADPDAPPLEPPSPPAGLRPEPAEAGPPTPPPAPAEPALPEPPLEAGPPTPPPEPGPPTPAPAPAEPALPQPESELPLESESLEELMAEDDEPLPGDATGEPSGAPLEPPTDLSPEPPASELPNEGLDPDAGVPEPPPPPPEPGTEPPGRARGRVHIPTQEHHADDLVDTPPSDEYEQEPIGEISDAPLEPEGAADPATPPPEAEAAPELFDFETDEASFPEVAEPPAEPAEPADDFDALGPAEDEPEYLEEEDEEPYAEEPAEEPGASAGPAVEEYEETEAPADEEEPAFDETAIREPDSEEGFHDTAVREPDSDEEPGILKESPEFTDEATEGEDLWFEKGPPKDFDFEEDDQK